MNPVKTSRLLLTALLAGSTLATVSAQTDKTKEKEEVKVKIIERTDAGEVREMERTYRFDGMRDSQRDEMVNKLVDSLRAKRGDKKSQLTIIIDDNRDVPKPGQSPRPRVYARRPGEPFEFRYYRDGKLEKRYNFNPDSLAQRFRNFEFTFPENWSTRMNDAFRGWSFEVGDSPKASTIRGLQVYPNNPEQHELNIRFSAPAKGDVKIRVTTPDGKEVARKDVKDFSGNYTGQVDIGRKAKGVYFVTVTQNDDGATRRIVVSE